MEGAQWNTLLSEELVLNIRRWFFFLASFHWFLWYKTQGWAWSKIYTKWAKFWTALADLITLQQLKCGYKANFHKGHVQLTVGDCADSSCVSTLLRYFPHNLHSFHTFWEYSSKDGVKGANPIDQKDMWPVRRHRALITHYFGALRSPKQHT